MLVDSCFFFKSQTQVNGNEHKISNSSHGWYHFTNVRCCFLCAMFFFTYFNFTMVDFENTLRKKKTYVTQCILQSKKPNARQKLTVFFSKISNQRGCGDGNSGGNRMNIKVTRSINYLIYSNVWIIDNNLVIAIKNQTYFYRLIKLKYEIDWKSAVNSYHHITKVYLNN